MTIASESSKSPTYNCDGATVAFPVTMDIQAAADIQVIHTDSDGTDNILATSAYSVAPVGGSYPTTGVTVTTTQTYPATDKITILRNMTYTQATDLGNQGPYLPETLETALDKLTLLVQQLKESIGRSLLLDVTESYSSEIADYVTEVTTSNSAIAATVNGLAIKAPVDAVTTANITLSGDQTIDDVAVSQDDRVLVKDQTDPKENGIYKLPASGAWVRATDSDSGAEIHASLITAKAGTANGGKLFQNTNTTTPTIATDNITYASFTGVTADQLAALAGTEGTPSASNKYVTDDDKTNNIDPVLATADQKAALAGTGTPAAGNKYVTNDTLTSTVTPFTSLASAQCDVGDVGAGTTGALSLSNNVNVTSVTKSNSTNTSDLDVVFASTLSDANYYVVAEVISRAGGSGSDFLHAPTVYDKTTAGFSIGLREAQSATQDIEAYFTVLPMPS